MAYILLLLLFFTILGSILCSLRESEVKLSRTSFRNEKTVSNPELILQFPLVQSSNSSSNITNATIANISSITSTDVILSNVINGTDDASSTHDDFNKAGIGKARASYYWILLLAIVPAGLIINRIVACANPPK